MLSKIESLSYFALVQGSIEDKKAYVLTNPLAL